MGHHETLKETCFALTHFLAMSALTTVHTLDQGVLGFILTAANSAWRIGLFHWEIATGGLKTNMGPLVRCWWSSGKPWCLVVTTLTTNS